MNHTIKQDAENTLCSGIGLHLQIGLAAVIALVVGVGWWAFSTPLSGAVLSSGKVVVTSNIKKIQHPNGGVIAALMVKDGETVKPGQLLVRLDDTLMKANLAVVTHQLDELAVRKARLRAEQGKSKAISFPASIKKQFGNARIDEIVNGERELFRNHREGLAGQIMQLGERIKQYREEITGLQAQEKNKAQELVLIGKELKALKGLSSRKLVTRSRLIAMQRDRIRIVGEQAQFKSTIAQAKGRISETKIQILQIAKEMRTENTKELRELQAREAELAEQRIAASDQLRRVEIRSPVDGIVHDMAVHTVGGVIQQGQLIMAIVPGSDQLILEATVLPNEIDRLYIGQLAMVRFSTFNHRTTPELKGRIKQIAAELTTDPATNMSYYKARIVLPPDELDKLDGKKLRPGMPAEIQIKTEARVAISYLLKPLQDQFARAFKER